MRFSFGAGVSLARVFYTVFVWCPSFVVSSEVENYNEMMKAASIKPTKVDPIPNAVFQLFSFHLQARPASFIRVYTREHSHRVDLRSRRGVPEASGWLGRRPRIHSIDQGSLIHSFVWLLFQLLFFVSPRSALHVCSDLFLGLLNWRCDGRSPVYYGEEESILCVLRVRI